MQESRSFAPLLSILLLHPHTSAGSNNSRCRVYCTVKLMAQALARGRMRGTRGRKSRFRNDVSSPAALALDRVAHPRHKQHHNGRMSGYRAQHACHSQRTRRRLVTAKPLAKHARCGAIPSKVAGFVLVLVEAMAPPRVVLAAPAQASVFEV